MLLGPPVPITGFAPATSGVAVTKPKVSRNPRSLLNKMAGLAKFGWFKTLKNSPRSCKLTRSVGLHVLTSEKSQFLNFGPRKVFRPLFPKFPKSGCDRTRSTGTGPVVEKLGIDDGSPITFQRSLNSPVRLVSFSKSTAVKGVPV